ncbi:uncharacterized protein LOC133142700 isoform X1 [Syngnathus typhle]|uniref:uncharacterized protein LOC133142700 isoform X1 n=1 Tax=Syngnathus typhle TaxID=161592 RepID=UPI002A6A992F|nr:uncharacterized protein LOC133142700 isoform X1 [Syngnathus typhle]
MTRTITLNTHIVSGEGLRKGVRITNHRGVRKIDEYGSFEMSNAHFTRRRESVTDRQTGGRGEKMHALSLSEGRRKKKARRTWERSAWPPACQCQRRSQQGSQPASVYSSESRWSKFAHMRKQYIHSFKTGALPFLAGPARRVFPKLMETQGVPLALHTVTLVLLVLCLLCSALSILISLYNSVSNPYETYMGPIGVYTCSAMSACLSVVVLVIFVVYFSTTPVAEDLVRSFSANVPVELKIKSFQMELGYYLVIPYAALSLLAIGLIYMYDHAAYTQRREQQRPTEDAPKEIMMY